jgi:hypothetical protein
MRHLFKQGAYRWAGIAVGVAVLAWLWFFAGHVRQPGGVKREWAVTVSRLLIAAGGILLVRLMLASYEERVPVFHIRSGDSGEGEFGLIVSALINLTHRGYQCVPLGDVVLFVRDNRYVPKKCFALVIEVQSVEQLKKAIGSAQQLTPTILVTADMLEDSGNQADMPALPEDAALGVSLRQLGDQDPIDREELQQRLRALSDRAAGTLGRRLEFARIEAPDDADLRGLLKSVGYTSFLDGQGYNRFGDEPHMIRLMNISGLGASEARIRRSILVNLRLFKGSYLSWPVAALGRLRSHGR